MIESLLDKVSGDFILTNDDIPSNIWNEKINSIAPLFMDIFDNILFAPLQANISQTPFPHSKQEHVCTEKCSIEVFTTRFRPTNEYYESNDLEIPQPENPNGYAATGVCLKSCLCAAFESGEHVQNATIEVEFEIWGRNEREKFIEFYNDHRFVVKKLLSSSEYSFFTSCVFDSLESYRGNNIGKMLDLYVNENEDRESHFTISYEHNSGQEVYELVKSYLTLAYLYDSFMQYLIKRGNKEKIYSYYIKK